MRRLDIVLAVGDRDPFLDNNRQLGKALWGKGVWRALHIWQGRAHSPKHWRKYGGIVRVKSLNPTEPNFSDGGRPVNFTLRPMQTMDLPDATTLTVESFTIDGTTLGQYAATRVRERLASSFRHHEYAPRFIVAVKEDGELIGVAGWGKLEFASRTWGLFLSSVSRDYRGQGVGTALVQERLRRIKQETQKGRILVSTKHRKRFEKLGFRSVDYDEELSLHLMLKNLDTSRSRRAS